jgi:hypothetical protein
MFPTAAGHRAHALLPRSPHQRVLSGRRAERVYCGVHAAHGRLQNLARRSSVIAIDHEVSASPMTGTAPGQSFATVLPAGRSACSGYPAPSGPPHCAARRWVGGRHRCVGSHGMHDDPVSYLHRADTVPDVAHVTVAWAPRSCGTGSNVQISDVVVGTIASREPGRDRSRSTIATSPTPERAAERPPAHLTSLPCLVRPGRTLAPEVLRNRRQKIETAPNTGGPACAMFARR